MSEERKTKLILTLVDNLSAKIAGLIFPWVLMTIFGHFDDIALCKIVQNYAKLLSQGNN